MRPSESGAAQEAGSELLVSIGGVVGHLRLVDASPALLRDLRRRYDGFLLPCSPEAARTFNLVVTFRPGAPTPIDERNMAAPPRVRSQRDRLDVKRADFRARLAVTAGQQWQGQAVCRPTHVAFESLLRILWSVFLPRAGGALFHACGFQHRKRGILAAGRSGAGKSTLARKVPSTEDLFSDEVVAVHRDGSGQWRLSGTPFFGELGRGAASLQSVPLAGLAFLEKANRVAVEPLPPGEAVQRALECLLCFERDRVTVEQNVALTVNLCASVPCFRLESRLDSPFEELGAAMQARLLPSKAQERGAELGNGGTARESISALRAALARHGQYAFRPRGHSMRPWLRSGDILFVEHVSPESERQLRPGDVVLYWRAASRPENDALICHRLVARTGSGRVYAKGDALSDLEAFDDGRQALIIGRVRSICRQGQARSVPGRLVSVAILAASLLTMPLLRLLPR